MADGCSRTWLFTCHVHAYPPPAIHEHENSRAVWCTAGRWEQIKDAYDVPVAPEICVEVCSPSNADAEIDEKRQLYLDAGAEEVWICDEGGQLTFYDDTGERETSLKCRAGISSPVWPGANPGRTALAGPHGRPGI